MTALPDKCYSGCHEATEEEDDLGTLGKEIWRGKCGQQTSGSAGGRWTGAAQDRVGWRRAVCGL